MLRFISVLTEKYTYILQKKIVDNIVPSSRIYDSSCTECTGVKLDKQSQVYLSMGRHCMCAKDERLSLFWVIVVQVDIVIDRNRNNRSKSRLLTIMTDTRLLIAHP